MILDLGRSNELEIVNNLVVRPYPGSSRLNMMMNSISLEGENEGLEFN